MRPGKEDDPLPILYQETEQNTYIILDIRSAKYERFIETFLKRDKKNVAIEDFSAKKNTLFSSFGFFSIYFVFTEEFHSLLCFHYYCVLEEFRPVSA